MSDRPALLLGPILGLVASVFGYLLTALVVALTEDDIGSDYFEFVGWVYYNAQFVDVEFSVGGEFSGAGFGGSFNVVRGSGLFGDIGGISAPAVLYHLLPVLALVLAGFLLARLAGRTDLASGAAAGASLVLGALVFAVLGTFLFESGNMAASIGPPLVEGALVVGVVYPLVCGALGGALGGATNAGTPVAERNTRRMR
jgi:hypothetical protein